VSLIPLENIKEPYVALYTGSNYCDDARAQEIVEMYEVLHSVDRMAGALKSMISQKRWADAQREFWFDMYLRLREEYVNLEENSVPNPVKKSKKVVK
jgi:hypothetical protein